MDIAFAFLGFILGAVAGGLIERMLDELLPEKLQRLHIVALAGAIVGLVLAAVLLANVNGADSNPTLAMAQNDIGDNAIVAGGDVIINEAQPAVATSGQPPPQKSSPVPQGASEPVTFSVEKGRSQQVRIADEVVTVSILQPYGWMGPGETVGDTITVNVSSKYGGKTYAGLRLGQCIHFHPILLNYVQVHYRPMSNFFSSADFTAYTLDDASGQTSLCPGVEPVTPASLP